MRMQDKSMFVVARCVCARARKSCFIVLAFCVFVSVHPRACRPRTPVPADIAARRAADRLAATKEVGLLFS